MSVGATSWEMLRSILVRSDSRDRQDEFLSGASDDLSWLRNDLPDLVDSWTESSSTGSSEGLIDVIDMFSGCGGMSTGFAALNVRAPLFRHVMAFDVDPVANRTYERNVGLEPCNTDIHELASDLKQLDAMIASARGNTSNPLVLIGCAPCQGFSSHRNSAGATDPRNDLFVDFARIAAHIKPDYVIVENVPEILTTRYWPVVQQARDILANAGYATHLTAHNMAEFDVPQERYRAVLTAARHNFRGPTPTRTRSDFRTVRDAISHLPKIAAGKVHPSDAMHKTVGHREETIELIKAVPRNGGNRPSHLGPNSLRTLAARQNKPGYEDVYGRLWWDRPSITMTAYSRNPASGRFLHPEQHRALSIREAACLQSFPRTFQFEGTLDQAFRQIGNAVPPLFAAHLALSVVEDLMTPREPSGMDEIETGLVAPLGESFSRLIPSLKSGSRRLEAADRKGTE